MKKILSLFFALALTVGAWAASAYPAYIDGPVTVTDLTEGTDYCYQLDFCQMGSNQYFSTARMVIYPKSHSIAGTYTLSDFNSTNSFVYYNGAFRKVANDGTKVTNLTIIDNGDGTYTFQGVFRTKNGSNYYYYYYNVDKNTLEPLATPNPKNTFTPILSTSAYQEEYGGQALTMATSYIDKYNHTSSGYLLLDLSDEDGNVMSLELMTSTDAIPAGTYSVANTGADGTIKASIGMDSWNPDYSYATYYDAKFNPFNYFITGGSVTIGYSADNRTMTTSGTLTTAHGSTITVSGSSDNPFYVPEPEEITVSVTSIAASLSGTTLTLNLTGTPKGKITLTNAGNIVGTYATSNFNGNYTYFGEGYYNDPYIDKSQTNSATITAGQETNSYVLNASLICDDGNTYKIVDAPFTYAPPTPWDAETAKKTDFTSTATYLKFTNNTINGSIKIGNASDKDWNDIYFAFAANTFDIPAGTYDVEDAVADTYGYFIASPGKINNNNKESYLDSWDYGMPFYARSGSITVSYSQNKKTIYLDGTVTTYRGTKITIDWEAQNPFYAPTYTLNVSDVQVSINTGITLDITASFNDGEVDQNCTAQFLLTGTTLVGTFPNAKIGEYSYLSINNTNYFIDKAKTNSVTISGENPEYTLSATLVCEDGATYKIENAAFTYLPPLSDTEDNTSLLQALSGKTYDITLGRNLYCDGYWNTICLPFDFAITNDNDNPLKGAEAAEFSSAELADNGLALNFTETTTLQAGVPYLIRWTDPSNTPKQMSYDGTITNPVFKGVTVTASEASAAGSGDIKFQGTFIPTQLTKDDKNYLFFGDADMLYYAGVTNDLKGFRAYFQLTGAAASAQAPARIVMRDNTVTGNNFVPANAANAKMMKQSKLLILKNGACYNALGQEIKK